ncbi:homeotic protein spalt-major isoform X2 [Fopius arisanus]|uniref:Homeotic protein spalt-major n=1 Tax=Fopius arisanus TaxID=64838 RepID=A0A9R1T3T6_9HYME|nr:PREDICTED: homeotic protein spalt-major-like isoform X2 [Fopius arisanus]
MQLMRWSITRRMERRSGQSQRRDVNCLEEDNETGSESEEPGRVPGEDPVDLTSNRSHQEDDDDREELPMEEDEEELPEELPEVFEPEEDEEGNRKQMRNRQDAENNNSFIEGGASGGFAPAAGCTSHVTLEALQNTKVAVAQFAATALSSGADPEAALQDLALLQSTLYTLQHQQVFQLQLISQLQQQLSITHGPGASGQPLLPPEGDSKETPTESPSPTIHPKPLSSLTSPPTSRPSSHHTHHMSTSTVSVTTSTSPVTVTSGFTQDRPNSSSVSPIGITLPSSTLPSSTTTPTIPVDTSSTLTPTSTTTTTLSHHMPPSLCSISSSLASTIITNNDPLPLNEPNTLEMLQKRAQEVLDNASQGLLANNLADELAFRSGKGSRLSPYDSKSSGGRGEPFFKHRCRYCGKVFGSDSALQIHIRSHTGERPFKCNVCGSRFTTKGNLKVHFQRHTAKFPHVKMNPNPVPEHLDKYHPPLLQQLAASGQRPLPSPPPPSGPTGPPTSGSSMSHHTPYHPSTAHGFIPPQPPLPLSLTLPAAAAAIAAGMPSLYHRVPMIPRPDQDQETPENLSKTIANSGPPAIGLPASTTSPSPVHSPKSPIPNNTSQPHTFQDREERLDAIKREHRASPVIEARPPSQSNEPLITLKKEPEDPEEVIEEEPEEFDTSSPRSRYLDQPLTASPQPTPDRMTQQNYEDCSMDSSKASGRLEPDEDEGDEEMEEQPENLSGRGTGRLGPASYHPSGASPASSTASSGSLQTSFAGLLFPQVTGPASGPVQQLPPHLSSAPHHPGVNVSESMIVDPARDPAIYSSLLPRPGSNDNSWESLIEITKTSETSKLQQLVDNIEHKLTDPNQCVICHRVLSCKSALQMHYRTHTGERPFKCKICGRAFTTKGNLKTHMGVHRAKPPLRVLHQCPVCHKKFTNALVLQQHIRLHTGEPTDLSPEQIQAAEVNEFPPGYPPHPLASFLPGGFPNLHPPGAFPMAFPPRHPAMDRHHQDPEMDMKDLRPQMPNIPMNQRYVDESEDMDDQEEPEDDERRDEEIDESERQIETEIDEDNETERNETKESSIPNFSTSLAALENQVRTITTMASVDRTSPMDRYNSEKSNSPPSSIVGTPLDLTPRASSTPGSVVSTTTPPPPANIHHSHTFGMFAGLLQAVSSSPTSVNNIQSSGPINSIATMNNPGNGGNPGALASLTTSAVLAASSTYNPLGLAVGGPAVRGNTTCNICYKTFACNSALEIHYRSHTKERPFKCTICDRGFSTKGNMKQHMLTHKIRDMPPHLFSDKQVGQQTPQHNQDQENSQSSICTDESSLPPPPPPPPPLPPPPSPMPIEAPMPVKRSPTEGDLPAPKRPSMSSKHLCQVCNKNFSSSSALQIHMRTHTGDKPFRCTVCQKAFTTKGNLKVHMGTHMWTNGASRRGRRMSLDLPPLPITPKDSEFLQRRPDLFYPYLPGPFLNGVQQKLNEISVIQSNNGLPVSHPVSGSKYAGLFGTIYGGGLSNSTSGNGFSMEKQPVVTSNSPLDDGKPLVPSGSMLFHTPSPSNSPGTPSSNTGNQNSASVPTWNSESIQHHYDRHGPTRETESDTATPAAPRLPPPANRGEGLAA